MKKFFILVAIATMCVFNCSAQITREGKTFKKTASARSKETAQKDTGYLWTDSKGVEYPIYMGASGACYVVKISKKTNKEYKQYLDKEVSMQICKELGIEYKPKK